jgi:hypothetical protein
MREDNPMVRPTYREEATRILEEMVRDEGQVEYVNDDKWTIRLRDLDPEEAEKARLALADELVLSLEAKQIRSRTIRNGDGVRIEVEIEDDGDLGDDPVAREMRGLGSFDRGA